MLSHMYTNESDDLEFEERGLALIRLSLLRPTAPSQQRNNHYYRPPTHTANSSV